ncbi:MAG: GGDEF domain-containing protein [Kofleriaceae bacterium]
MAAIGLVGALDLLTGVEARVFPLYYVPIMVAALRASWRAGLAMGVLSAVAWSVAMAASGPGWSAGMFAFNVATQTSSFLAIALLSGGVARRLEREQALSRTDELTGLANRRAMEELTGLLVAGARRSGRPLTIAYLDLDNFKTVNDDHGHDAGDRALADVAAVLRRSTRSSDVIARLGGDEFAVLLPDADGAAARTVLERIRRGVAAAMAAQRWPITVSIGGVVFAPPPATAAAAIATADEVMYRAKAAGKNRLQLEQVAAAPLAARSPAS